MKRFLFTAVAALAIGATSAAGIVAGIGVASAASYSVVAGIGAGSYAAGTSSVDGGGSATPGNYETANSFDNGSTVAHSSVGLTKTTSYANNNEAGGGHVEGGGIGGFDYAGTNTSGSAAAYGIGLGLDGHFDNF